MSNLSVYSGDFTKFADNEFSGDVNSRKTFSGIDGLDLSVSCPVGIFASSDNQVVVEIDAEDLNDFSVSRDGSICVVKEKEGGETNSVIFNNGSVVSVNVGSGMSIINGRVFVNGQEVKPGNANTPVKRQSRIRIFAPRGVDLSADLNGSSILASKVIFRKASIKVSGQATVGLAAKTVKLRIGGQGESFIVMQGGDLNASLSGQGSVRVKGEYASADVSVSGQGNVTTDGKCLGDYDASVSGMGNITHQGSISGRKRKSVTGMGHISI